MSNNALCTLHFTTRVQGIFTNLVQGQRHIQNLRSMMCLCLRIRVGGGGGWGGEGGRV